MTVAIQIEGHEQGMQSFEERYILFRACSEADAISRAEAAAPAYGEPYSNTNKQRVRWHVESIDGVYEVVLNNPKNLDGAEVFSVLKTRKLTPERVWK